MYPPEALTETPLNDGGASSECGTLVWRGAWSWLSHKMLVFFKPGIIWAASFGYCEIRQLPCHCMLYRH